jgi:hypothetical protein
MALTDNPPSASAASSTPEFQLPPTAILLEIFSVFCSRFQSSGLFNFLHPLLFRQAIVDNPSDHKELLLGILCLTLRFSAQLDLTYNESECCEAALQSIRNTPDDYSLRRMQALLLLALYDCR